MLIWKQRPDASFVGGFNTWLKCGRYVRKGEKGIAILAPMFFKDKTRMADGSEGETKRIWFKVVYVFDISQTDGTPLPELPTKSTGERGEDMLERLLRFAASRGITVRFVDKCKLNGARGTSKGTEIEIRTTETDVTTQAATLAHEIAHCLLHWTADGHKITTRDGREIGKQQRELEAEAVAYVVGSYFGIQSPSDFYLATYSVTPAMLLEAVETIAKTARQSLTVASKPSQSQRAFPCPLFCRRSATRRLSMSNLALAFPQPLAERYQPQTVADFVGLEKPKRIMEKFCANPYPSAWLFVGPSGTGKTSMALAICKAVGGELHHIPSQSCDLQRSSL